MTLLSCAPSLVWTDVPWVVSDIRPNADVTQKLIIARQGCSHESIASRCL